MRNALLLIAGQNRAASNGASFDRLNPVTGSPVTRASAATLEDADAAVAAAKAAFPAWAALAPSARRARLLKAAELLEANTEAFVEIGIAETGGTGGWYAFNVMLAANMLREAASMVTRITGEVLPSDIPGSLAMAIRQPCGVVLGIAPWNAPIILGVRAIAMPLACGNTVVLKSSEQCPGLHHLIGSVLQEAGLGDGVVNVLNNAPADAPALVERLIANPAVRRINFTGSTNVGRIIAQLAAKQLKPVLLELGGNNPLVVLDDADLKAAVDAAIFSAFMNQGQICMSAGRLIVNHRIADRFVDLLAERAAALKAAAPDTGASPLGALVSSDTAQRCKLLIDTALRDGATLRAGGGIDGAIMQPTVVDHVTSDMAIYREESFGNLVSVIRVDSDEEALRIANDSEYGLSAAVFSRDIERALAFAQRVETGICHINGPTVHDEAQMPFGGVKASGYGRFGGTAAVAEFTDLRWITFQNGPRHYPI